MAGMLASALLQGLGQGGKAYLDQEEARRRESAANQEAYNRAYFSAGLVQDAKDRAQESEDKRKKERYAEFQTAVAQWRTENPDAPPSKMLADFADTEFVDLLAGKLQAAKLINDEEAQKATEAYRNRELDIREKTANRAAAGQEHANSLAAMQIKQAQQRLDQAEQDRAETEQKKGLLRGYVTAKATGAQQGADTYARELEAMGVSVGPEPEYVKQTTKTMDANGEVTTERRVPIKQTAGAPPESEPTGETFNWRGREHPVLQDATGVRFIMSDGVAKKLPENASAKPTASEEKTVAASSRTQRDYEKAQEAVAQVEAKILEASARGDTALVNRLVKYRQAVLDSVIMSQALGH